MKICSKCKTSKDLDQFHQSSRSSDGRQGWCKECNKSQRLSYYHTDKGKLSNRNSRLFIYARNSSYVQEYLRDHPCIVCGESDIVVLEFDHRDRGMKKYNIADMIKGYSLEALQAEIEKCDVLCANDHRRRTATQFRWSKLK